MNRPLHCWLTFGFCFAILLGAMGWVSWTAFRLDQTQRDVQSQADFEEKVRLALWRMDSTLSPLIVQESSRPYFTYSAFFPAGRAYNKMFSELQPDEVLLPSPLLAPASTNVLLHFQYAPDGRLTSPQVPSGNKRDLAESRYLTAEEIRRAEGQLQQLQALLNPQVLVVACATNLTPATVRTPALRPDLAQLQEDLTQQSPVINSPAVPLQNRAVQQQQVKVSNYEQQARLNQAELQARSSSYQQAANWNNDNNRLRSEIAEGTVKPIWFGDALVLARHVTVDNQRYIQGCWLDWPNIRHWMLATINDLLPQATLEPINNAAAPPQDGRLLASLPVRLVPGPVAATPLSVSSPVRYALIVAWLGILLAGSAVAVLLHGAVSLSERRGAFVSAVTHELRTPLTTFKMYSEMLAEGMVPDESKRRQYLQTLCSEANRLSHLVENVLAYARLERGSARSRAERLRLGELIQRVKPRLIQRVEQAGMRLIEDGDDATLQMTVHVDPGAVEQILFNLVDNACKYAGPATTEKVIHLEALPDGKFTMLRVRDHGQGVSREGARRLFQPFSKSAHEAAHTAPGVGLGLALCRRLSRSMGGDLQLDALVRDGACFVLKLPLVV